MVSVLIWSITKKVCLSKLAYIVNQKKNLTKYWKNIIYDNETQQNINNIRV